MTYEMSENGLERVTKYSIDEVNFIFDTQEQAIASIKDLYPFAHQRSGNIIYYFSREQVPVSDAIAITATEHVLRDIQDNYYLRLIGPYMNPRFKMRFKEGAKEYMEGFLKRFIEGFSEPAGLVIIPLSERIHYVDARTLFPDRG